MKSDVKDTSCVAWIGKLYINEALLVGAKWRIYSSVNWVIFGSNNDAWLFDAKPVP